MYNIYQLTCPYQIITKKCGMISLPWLVVCFVSDYPLLWTMWYMWVHTYQPILVHMCHLICTLWFEWVDIYVGAAALQSLTSASPPLVLPWLNTHPTSWPQLEVAFYSLLWNASHSLVFLGSSARLGDILQRALPLPHLWEASATLALPPLSHNKCFPRPSYSSSLSSHRGRLQTRDENLL